jgi:hypothetical protein
LCNDDDLLIGCRNNGPCSDVEEVSEMKGLVIFLRLDDAAKFGEGVPVSFELEYECAERV